MAVGFFVTNAAAQAMLNAWTAAADAGTAAIVRIYAGSVPADADASLSSNDTLATLTCSTTSFGAATDNAGSAKITANAITADASADSTNTATFFRILTQDAGTVVAQGTAGVGTFDLALNTAAITSASTVSITAATITLPEG